MQLMETRIKAALTLLAWMLAGIAAGCGPVEPTASQASLQPAPATSTLPPLASLPTAPTEVPVRTILPHYTPTPRLITPAPSEGTFTDQSVLSPDGIWTAEPSFETIVSGYRIKLQVFNKDKSKVWTPVDYEGEGLGYSMPTPKHWSADSRYFYYVEKAVADGCGDFFPVEKAWQRLEVETGEVDSVELPSGRGHSFSPDDAWLVYISDEMPLELVVVETLSGVETTLALLPEELDHSNAQGGQVIWSPQSDAIVFAVATGLICGEIQPVFSMFRADLEPLKVVSLYEGSDYLYPLQWDPSGKILVRDWNLKSWWIDAANGYLTTSP